jgi:hypothetical protein
LAEQDKKIDADRARLEKMTAEHDEEVRKNGKATAEMTAMLSKMSLESNERAN